MQGRYINLFYTSCGAKKSGDLAAACEAMFATHQYYQHIGVNDIECYVAGSASSVGLLKSLYGNGSNDTVSVHNTNFRVVLYADFVKTPDARYTLNFINVGCDSLSQDEIFELSKQTPNLQVNVVMLANWRTANSTPYAQGYPNFKVNFIHIGLQSWRIGMSLHVDPPQPLVHARYNNITDARYAVAYFNSYSSEAQNLLADFFETCAHYRQVRNFVIIGETQLAENSVAAFLEGVEASGLLFNDETKKIYLITYCTIRKLQLKYDVTNTYGTNFYHEFLQQNNITLEAGFQVIKRLSNPDFRTLMHHADPLVCTTGVASAFEAISFGKICFYQFIKNNKLFYDSYVERVLLELPIQLYANAEELLDLLNWNAPHSNDKTLRLLELLNDTGLVDAISAINKNLQISTIEFGKRFSDSLLSPARVGHTLFAAIPAAATTPTIALAPLPAAATPQATNPTNKRKSY